MTPTRHDEFMVLPGRRLGRRPHDPQRPALRLSRLLTGVVPPHPATVDHLSLVPPSRWGMLGNDQFGCCGPADVWHDRMLVAKYLGNVDVQPDNDAVLDLYRRSGNPNFPADDNGVVMADMLSEVHKNGIGPAGHQTKCVAYAQVNVADLDEVRAALAIFGDLSVGADMQHAQQAQTTAGDPWDFAPNSPDWGGHAFLTGAYTGDTTAGRPDIGWVSWGRPGSLTDQFWQNRVREAWVTIWPEHLTNRAFLTGVDQAFLAHDYKILTGQDLPVNPLPPSPAPVPPGAGGITQAQVLANQQLAAISHAWTKYAHAGMNGDVARALTNWLSAWGL